MKQSKKIKRQLWILYKLFVQMRYLSQRSKPMASWRRWEPVWRVISGVAHCVHSAYPNRRPGMGCSVTLVLRFKLRVQVPVQQIWYHLKGCIVPSRKMQTAFQSDVLFGRYSWPYALLSLPLALTEGQEWGAVLPLFCDSSLGFKFRSDKLYIIRKVA